MHTIKDEQSFLKVTLNGAKNVEDLLESIRDVASHPNYHCRNDIWLLGPDFIMLQYDDLQVIADFIQGSYPPNLTRTKTAFVTPPGLNSAIVSLWVDTALCLPYKTQVFSDLESAKAWIAI